MSLLAEALPKTTDIKALFEKQRAHALVQGQTSISHRKAMILRLRDYVVAHTQEISEAMYKDFRKSPEEVLLSEISIVLQAARYVTSNLDKWMKVRQVPTPLIFTGTAGYLQPESKGNVLILSPWNYPINISLAPLIYSIAAGNVTILKPSEITSHTSAWMAKMARDIFTEEEVAVVEGDVSVAQELLAQPFNHIYFTGSPQVGKAVMHAAAEHLASVTLELGGKSPLIIDETADIPAIIHQAVWSKFINTGQTCIASDYALVHRSKVDAFVGAYTEAMDKMSGGPGAAQQSPTLARLASDRQFVRVKRLLDDAVAKGARILQGGKTAAEERFIEPTLLTDVSDDMLITQEEIFGPLLSVIPYDSLDEVVQYINARPRPLTMYFMSTNKLNIDFILSNTRSGPVMVNDTMLHFGHMELPFGGINNSGQGSSTGYAAFREFSHERGVMVRKWATMSFLYPPYNDLKRTLLNAFKRIL